MESVLGRYRNLIILVVVLFLQVLGLAVQVKRSANDVENTRLIRIWVVDAITPFERGLVWLENGGNALWHNYFYLRGVRAENRQLKEQIEQMRLEQVRLTEDAAQAHRLQNLLAFKEQYIAKTVAAQVVGSSGSDLSRIVYIDKGEDVGLKRDMAVITADGIVGKIMLVYPSVSQVLLINDQTSGVGVILEKTRLQGVLRGTANGEVVLERVMSDEQVPVGETVLTSGGDQIFPKGLPVGTIAKVGNGKDLFLNIKVKPAANLSKLEEVLVLVDKQERQATADDSSHARAADILAQRLPSVPDKPPDATATPAGEAVQKQSASSAVTKPAGTAPKPQIANPLTPTANHAPAVAANSGTAAANSTGAQASAPKPAKTPAGTVNGAPSGVSPLRANATPANSASPTSSPRTTRSADSSSPIAPPPTPQPNPDQSSPQ